MWWARPGGQAGSATRDVRPVASSRTRRRFGRSRTITRRAPSVVMSRMSAAAGAGSARSARSASRTEVRIVGKNAGAPGELRASVKGMLVRHAVDWTAEPADAALLVRGDERPFALCGAWAGGWAVAGSEP